MSTNQLENAVSEHKQVPEDWMSATQVSPFIFDDPGLVWLQYYGEKHGFQPDSSPYEFLDFISEKARQFEHKWRLEMAPQAEAVCTSAAEVRSADKVRQTFDLMQQGALVIAQPALWWGPERIYGVPDLLVHTSWFKDRFPTLLEGIDSNAPAAHLGHRGNQGHYVVMDLKFTTKLDDRSKVDDLESYTAQVRLYSYMLGNLQGVMPKFAFLIARDRIEDSLPVEITSVLNHPLDPDLASMRDSFVEIKLNGDQYRPWKDDIVALNFDHSDERWSTAKATIARDYIPGGDVGLLYYIGRNAKTQLAVLGYPNLTSMLSVEPLDIPFEDCKGIGAKVAARMRAILQANRLGSPVLPPPDLIPSERRFEFYVDYEYFTNVNVDFEAQWPTLEGKEMIFMIGLGWRQGENWRYETLAAEAEDIEAERELLDIFIQRLDSLTEGAILDRDQTALYHWSSAEVWQSRRASERHQLSEDHPLRNLPWLDLSKVFLDGPGAIPGIWDFGLKAMARALCEYDPRYSIVWPGDLDKGLRVMVMGWKAYQSASPLDTYEMDTIRRYLETDCKALYEILRWLRNN